MENYKIYESTCFVVKHASGIGELSETFATEQDAVKASKRSQEHEIACGFTPSRYLIYKREWKTIRVGDRLIETTTTTRFICDPAQD